MKVTIFGYTELFAVNPDVAIYKGNELLGHVSRNGKLELEIDEPCVLIFKSSIRSAQCAVSSDTSIVLSFNRVLGTLSAKPAVSQEAVQQTITEVKSSDKKRVMWTLIIVGASVGTLLLISLMAFVIACL